MRDRTHTYGRNQRSSRISWHRRAVPGVEELEPRRLLSLAGLLGTVVPPGGAPGGGLTADLTTGLAVRLGADAGVGVDLSLGGQPTVPVPDASGGTTGGLGLQTALNLVSLRTDVSWRVEVGGAISLLGNTSVIVLVPGTQPQAGAGAGGPLGGTTGGGSGGTGLGTLPGHGGALPVIGSGLPAEQHPEGSVSPAVVPVAPAGPALAGASGAGAEAGAAVPPGSATILNHPVVAARAAAVLPALVPGEQQAVPAGGAAGTTLPPGVGAPGATAGPGPTGPLFTRAAESSGGGGPYSGEWEPQGTAPETAPAAAPAIIPPAAAAPAGAWREAVDAALATPVWESLPGLVHAAEGLLSGASAPTLAGSLAAAAALGLLLAPTWGVRGPDVNLQKRHSFRRI